MLRVVDVDQGSVEPDTFAGSNAISICFLPFQLPILLLTSTLNTNPTSSLSIHHEAQASFHRNQNRTERMADLLNPFLSRPNYTANLGECSMNDKQDIIEARASGREQWRRDAQNKEPRLAMLNCKEDLCVMVDQRLPAGLAERGITAAMVKEISAAMARSQSQRRFPSPGRGRGNTVQVIQDEMLQDEMLQDEMLPDEMIQDEMLQDEFIQTR